MAPEGKALVVLAQAELLDPDFTPIRLRPEARDVGLVAQFVEVVG